ncbi:hypothetical protein MTO96_025414 [Rhipicephalus appendiculatus]
MDAIWDSKLPRRASSGARCAAVSLGGGTIHRLWCLPDGCRVRAEVKKRDGNMENYADRDFIDGYLRKIQENKETNSHYTTKYLEGNALNFYGAGTYSVRTVSLWSLYIAASDPEGMQARVQEEIDSVVGRQRTPAWEDRVNMPYTMASILETMRWRTPTPFNLHRAFQEEVERFLEFLTSGKGGPVRIAQPLASSVANNISALVFGQRYDLDDPKGRVYEGLLSTFLRYANFFSVMDFLPCVRTLAFHIPNSNLRIMNYVMKELTHHVRRTGATSGHRLLAIILSKDAASKKALMSCPMLSKLKQSNLLTFEAMASFVIQPPDGFNFSSPNEWPKWKQRFERFRTSSGLCV